MQCFKTFEILKIYTKKYNHFQEGDIVKVSDEDKMYIYKNSEWSELKINSNLEMSLYDLNKQAIAQLNSLTSEQWEHSIKLINQWSEWQRPSSYYMLLCKDISYFTVLIKDESYNVRTVQSEQIDNLGLTVQDCLNYIGETISIEETENCESIEIWVKQNDEVYCFYLFDYADGIVKFK